MDAYEIDFDDPLILLPPIAGGDGDDEGGEVIADAEPAGDETGGDDSGEESGTDVADGEEQQPEVGETDAEVGEDGEPEVEAPGARPGMIPYSRFQEVVARAQMAERNLQLALGRQGGEATGSPAGGRPAPRELPKEYGELDKGMGGYMRYYLDPLAEGLLSMREQITDFGDQANFYRGAGRGLNERQVQLVEQARESLSQKLRQPVERADALLFLRGHPKYGSLFVDRKAAETRALANGVTAARRSAGKLGGRGAVARGRGPQEPVDLNRLPRSERIKVFEREMGNTPV